MKTIVHTLRWGSPDWMILCVPTLEAWCLRHGYDLQHHSVNLNPDKFPNDKFAAEFEALQSFTRGSDDRMIWVDADVYVNPEAPAFPELPGLAMATDGMHESIQGEWGEWCMKNFGVRPPGFSYSNAGVWSIDRSAAKAFLKFFKPPFIEGDMDQRHFNLAAYQAREAGMTFSRLPSTWNRWARDLNPAWFCHAWGSEKIRDLETRRDLGLLDRKPDGLTYCFMPPGFPAQDKYIVLQFVKDCGLGNMMFELAAGLHLGDRLQLPVILNWLPTAKRSCDLDAFGIGVLPFKEFPIVSQRLGQGNAAIVDRSATAIHESLERFPAVSHPFQSEECFPRAADKVRELFRLEPLPLEVPEGKTPVAVQVRRGDYVRHPRLNVTTPGYFLNGIDHLRQRVKHPHFYVLSDDPEWCRQQFGHLPDITVMPSQTAIEGLRTMMACKAAIISNSTFGWWGAWLSGADPVVVPEMWATNMRFYGDWKPAPDRWHRVSVTRKIEQKPLVSPKPIISGFKEYPRQFERAIVIPWHAKSDRWHSLRYCLRSIHENFTDKDCPIVILGTARPTFLTHQRHRVIYEENWLYQDALMQGVQIADEVCWMNDDICFLQPTGWEDLRRPLHYGPFTDELLAEFSVKSNIWRESVLKTVARLKAAGVDPVLNYSTHTPYRFEREEAVELLKTLPLEHKLPFELAYFNQHAVGPKLMNGERSMEPDPKDARYWNWTDLRLSPELKAAVAARFPDWAPWEVPIPFAP